MPTTALCVCCRQLLHTLASMMILLCLPVEPEERVCLLPPAGSSQNCVVVDGVQTGDLNKQTKGY